MAKIMNKLSSIEYNISNIINKPSESLRRNIYKIAIKPESEKKDYNISHRLMLAGLAGGIAAGGGIGISKALKKMNPKIFKGKIKIPALVLSSLSSAALGYFHPDIRNAVIDYHAHKDEKRLKEDIKQYLNSEKNIRAKGNEVLETYSQNNEMSKQSEWVKPVIKGIGNITSTIGKTIAGGFAFGGKPSIGQKVTRIAVKGTTLGGLGYGVYKGYQAVSRPQSTDNYTTFLRNNMLAGNISSNEITDREKSQINDLGMR